MELDEKEKRRLWDRFDAVSKKMKDSKTGGQAEMDYAIAYQDLVKAGLAQQIKKKRRTF